MKNCTGVAIPFEVGQVSTHGLKWQGRCYKRKVAIPFEVGQVSTLVEGQLSWEFSTVAIPFEVGQVSTMRGFWTKVEILTVAIPFEVGQVSTQKRNWRKRNAKKVGRNPFWSRAGFYTLEWVSDTGERVIQVAIPFEVGQVSTERKVFVCSKHSYWWVAIPFEVGQVSTGESGHIYYDFQHSESQSLLK